jgi:hypothetical protein
MAEDLFSSDMGAEVPGTLYLKDSDNVVTEYNPNSGNSETTFDVGPKCIILKYNQPDTHNFISLYSNKVPILCEYVEVARTIYLNMTIKNNDIAVFTAVTSRVGDGARLYSARYDITNRTWTVTTIDL